MELNGKLILVMSRALQEIHKESEVLFRKHHITMAQFTVLEALQSKGELTIQQIIEKVLSTSGNMTVVIKNLEAMKLVSRRQHPCDKRAYIIDLTKEGKKKIKVLFEAHMKCVEAKLGILSNDEKSEVIQILTKIAR